MGTGRLVDGRYRLGPLLGSGGMATVYRAWDTRLERAVAIKLYRPSADQAQQRRFGDEARVLASLSHPGLVAVHDAGTDLDGPYLVLRLVDGPTLRQRIADGPLPAAEVQVLGAQLADALAAVHAGGVVHRDVKPSNVLLDRDGAPHLADFGVCLLAGSARLTATGQLLGTAAYLAPEQVLGQLIGPPVDVYALGLMLLECLTGRTEFDGNDVEAAVARLYRRPYLPADLPPGLRAMLAAMTALDPAQRPSAAQCAVGLRQPTIVVPAPPAAPVPACPAPPRAPTPTRGLAATTAGIMAVAALMAWAMPSTPRPVHPAAAAAPAPAQSQTGTVLARQMTVTSAPSPQVITEAVALLAPPPAPVAAPATRNDSDQSRGTKADKGAKKKSKGKGKGKRRGG